MSCYYTKAGLYHEIEKIRKSILEYSSSDYPFNLVTLFKQTEFLAIETCPFKTKALRGLAIIAEDSNQNDIILLNSNLTEYEQNFYAGHELIHLILHRNEPKKLFNCYDDVRPNQDPFLEWQANEGSAEILVPYKELLPIIKNSLPHWNRWLDLYTFRQNLANLFHVSETVMELRIKSLKYEIFQYLNGIPLNEIKIMSDREQKNRNIHVKSLIDVEENLTHQAPFNHEKNNTHVDILSQILS